MARRKKSRPSTLTLLMLLLLGAAGVVALATYIKLAPADKVRPGEHRNSGGNGSGPNMDVHAFPADGQLYVPMPTLENGVLKFFRSAASPPAGEDARIWIVNRFLEDSHVIDPSARLLSIDVEAGIARLHFSDEFDQTQGSFDEAALIGGIRACLGQFPEIERLEFFVGGKPLDELGHFELGEPVEVIRPSDWDRHATPREGPPPSPAN